jgi:hypothetical protein
VAEELFAARIVVIPVICYDAIEEAILATGVAPVMCRYAFHNYRDHFACFACRKAFKYWQWEPCDEATWKKQHLKHMPRRIVCPDCGEPMVDMGLDFKAPKKSNREQWQILEALHANGFTFHGCGCYVGFNPPATLREVPSWLERRRRESEGKLLLKTFEERTAKTRGSS